MFKNKFPVREKKTWEKLQKHWTQQARHSSLIFFYLRIQKCVDCLFCAGDSASGRVHRHQSGCGSCLVLKAKMSVAQSCLTLCDSIDCSPLGSSVPEILQARILQWVAIPFSGGSSRPRDRIQVSRIAGRFFSVWATRDGEGNGTPLQYSCLENPMDRGAW